MVNVTKMFLLLGSLCLCGPVMADDDYDDGDYSAAPAVYKKAAATQNHSQSKASFAEILKASKDIAEDINDLDDGYYSAAPVAVKTQAAVEVKPQAKQVKQAKQAKVVKKEKTVVAQKKIASKNTTVALKDAWNKRSTVDPFE